MQSEPIFAEVAAHFQAAAYADARTGLAQTLRRLKDRFCEEVRLSAGSGDLDFEALQGLAPSLLYCYAVDPKAQLTMGFHRVSLAEQSTNDATAVLGDVWMHFDRSKIGRPYEQMVGKFAVAFYGSVSHAYIIQLNDDGSFDRFIINDHKSQTDATNFLQRYRGAFFSACRRIRPDSDTAMLLREAMIQFLEISQQRKLVAVPAIGATGTPVALRDAVVLHEDAYRYIEQRMHLFQEKHKAMPRGMCFEGPPGTGKSLLVQTIARSIDADIRTVSAVRSDVVARISDAFAASAKQHTIVHFENADNLFANRDFEQSNSWAHEAIGALQQHWQTADAGDRSLLIIFTVHDMSALDPAIAVLFGIETLHVDLPDHKRRERILAREFAKFEQSAVFAPELTSGFSGRDLASAVAASAAQQAAGKDITVAFPEIVHGMRAKRSTRMPDASWASLVLEQSTLSSLHGIAQRWKHAESLSALGFSLPKTLLLSGPPGTGKTQIARTLAQELKLAFFSVGPGDILGRYRGQTATNIQSLFRRAAHAAPAIVFFDELDAISRTRDDGNSHVEALTQMLHELDGLGNEARYVFVLAATNRADTLDEAILSRFGRQLATPLPDFDCRRRLFSTMLSRLPLACEIDGYVATLAERTDGCSGRDIRGIVSSIEDSAIDRGLTLSTPEDICITRFDLEGALRRWL